MWNDTLILPTAQPHRLLVSAKKNNKLRELAEHLVTLLSGSGVTGSAWRNLQGMRAIGERTTQRGGFLMLMKPTASCLLLTSRVSRMDWGWVKHILYFTSADTSLMGTPHLWGHLTCGDILLAGTPNLWVQGGHITWVDTSHVLTHHLRGQARKWSALIQMSASVHTYL